MSANATSPLSIPGQKTEIPFHTGRKKHSALHRLISILLPYFAKFFPQLIRKTPGIATVESFGMICGEMPVFCWNPRLMSHYFCSGNLKVISCSTWIYAASEFRLQVHLSKLISHSLRSRHQFSSVLRCETPCTTSRLSTHEQFYRPLLFTTDKQASAYIKPRLEISCGYFHNILKHVYGLTERLSCPQDTYPLSFEEKGNSLFPFPPPNWTWKTFWIREFKTPTDYVFTLAYMFAWAFLSET